MLLYYIHVVVCRIVVRLTLVACEANSLSLLEFFMFFAGNLQVFKVQIVLVFLIIKNTWRPCVTAAP